jgi:hypothetical protein
MKFSASWDESHYAIRRTPSLIRNNCLTKIPANKTRQIIERPELVTANAVGFTGFQWGPFHLDECMVRRATAREKRGREDKSAQMYSAFSGDQLSWP